MSLESQYATPIAQMLNVAPWQVDKTIALLDEGNTVPFIARYRKEATGTLDEEQIRSIVTELERLRKVDDRRATIIASVQEQEKLTDALHKQLQAAVTLTELDDLYQPYRPKRQTRASAARERGLQPLADLILEQALTQADFTQMAAAYLKDDVPTTDDAWAGARDIVAETVTDHPKVREYTRERALRFSRTSASRIEDADDPKGVFDNYHDFELRVDSVRPHQVLALNRGENQKVLKVAIDVAERDWRESIATFFKPDLRSPLADQLDDAIEDGVQRLLLPAIERDVRRTLTEKAEQHAIQVFADNLRALLNQPPLHDQTVLALDPGYRTGTKVAVMDPSGMLLQTGTIYPHPPQNQLDQSLKSLSALVQKYSVTLITIGNGTASRETEQMVARLIKEQANKGADLHYLMVDEAGASVYSASKIAREEFPDLDISLRSAVSIGRRIQDPLAELVKIDPKSIGVGLYQHDVAQKALSETLGTVVESVVNQVGVDANTASPALLTYVAGIGPKLAQRIVEYRNEQGPFTSRVGLKKVTGLGPKAFEQSAGFLRIREGKEPLDSSAIHPESYKVATQLLAEAGLTKKDSLDIREEKLNDLLAQHSLADLAQRLDTGEPTLADICEQLVRPGRDPRADLPPPILRNDVLSMDDLQIGMELQGTVRNVVDFGAFVDIGVKQSGLLHRSQYPRGYRPNVGDVITVEILSVEQERGRIGLGMKDVN